MENILNIRELREKTSGNTRVLWHHNYWDGMISGMILWEGEKAWFDQYDEVSFKIPISEEEKEELLNDYTEEELDEEDFYDFERYRYYNVYRLDKEVLEDLTYNHSLFQKYVGTHTDYDIDGNRHHNLAPASEHHKFYNREEKKCPVINKNENRIIGKFKY